MTSPYITQALERARLPIHMECHRISRAGHFRFMCSSQHHPAGLWSYSPGQATLHYLSLVASFKTDPGTSSRVPGSTAADLASTSPGEAT